ncbi:MAG: hypothetical protein WD579_01385 [Candidatus Paceibacterota bacterium]
MAYRKYKKGYKQKYRPKKPVRYFSDLEVYQKTHALSVFLENHILGAKKKTKKSTSKKPYKELIKEGSNEYDIVHKASMCARGIPHLIAEAHSYRFGLQEDCIIILEKVMANCNKMVVYLEQIRDVCPVDVDADIFEEKIKEYHRIRRKILNLQRVWRKYMHEKREEKINPKKIL